MTHLWVLHWSPPLKLAEELNSFSRARMWAHLSPGSGQCIKRNQIGTEEVAQCLRTLLLLQRTLVWFLVSISDGSQRPVILVPGNPTSSGLPGHLQACGAHKFTQTHICTLKKWIFKKIGLLPASPAELTFLVWCFVEYLFPDFWASTSPRNLYTNSLVA